MFAGIIAGITWAIETIVLGIARHKGTQHRASRLPRTKPFGCYRGCRYE